MEDFSPAIIHKFIKIFSQIKCKIENRTDCIPVISFKNMNEFDKNTSCDLLYFTPDLIIEIEGYIPVYLQIGKKFDLIYMKN